MTVTPLLRAYFQQPTADRPAFLLLLDEPDQRALQGEIMDVLDVVQTLFLELLVELQGGEPCSAATMTEFTALIEGLAALVAAEE